MTMLILHNRFDAASRAFVAAYGEDADVTVLDWNDDQARDEWLNAGGTLGVGAFPAVLFMAPEHAIDVVGAAAPGGALVEERRERPAGWEVLNLPDGIGPDGTPATIDIAKDRAIVIDALAAVTWVEAVAVQDSSALAAEAAKAKPIVDAAAAVAATSTDDAVVFATQQATERLALLNS